VALTTDDVADAESRRFSVAIVLHTTSSDWSRQQLAGIVRTLGECGTVVSEVVDCGFQAEAQIAALDRLGRSEVDAIISIPVGNAAVAEAHKAVAYAGKTLILHDNVPTGMLPGSHYTALVSGDNFGLGLIGADLLSPAVPENREVGLLAYGVDFYATNEREIAFSRWMKANRPDLTVRTKRFSSLRTVREAAGALLDAHPDLGGLFVVWDTPAMEAIAVLRRRGIDLPITTVDLGREAAVDLASGGCIRGIAAQQPFRQGVAVGRTTILSLLRKPVPRWIALPGLPVRRDNVAESYQSIWSLPAPREILEGPKP
jgi:ribose transport system substrate-binding protein